VLCAPLLRNSGLSAVAVHFHDSYGQELANVTAVLEVGVRIVNASVGGLGGCPFARSATDHLATEELVYTLDRLDWRPGSASSRLSTLRDGSAESSTASRAAGSPAPCRQVRPRRPAEGPELRLQQFPSPSRGRRAAAATPRPAGRGRCQQPLTVVSAGNMRSAVARFELRQQRQRIALAACGGGRGAATPSASRPALTQPFAVKC